MRTDTPKTAKHRARWAEAEAFAKTQRCLGPVYFVADKWGGYWQCLTLDKIVYTFSLPGAESGYRPNTVRS